MSTPSDLPDLAGLPLFAAAQPTLPGRGPVATAPPAPIPLSAARRRHTPATGPELPPDLDWTLVRALRGAAAKDLAQVLRDRTAVDRAEQRALGEQIVADHVRSYAAQRNSDGLGADRLLATQLHRAVMDALFGLGRLQPLVDNPDLEDIELYGFDRTVLIWADGRRTFGPPIADSDEELIEEIAYWAAASDASQRTFSPASPLLNLRLPGGARLSAHAWVSPRPVAVIRLHRLQHVTLSELVSLGLMTPEVHDVLARAVRRRMTIVVTGSQGAGKTTLLRALCGEFSPMESVTTIETEFELHLDEMPERHHRVHALEARPGSGERLADGRMAGEVDLTQLTKNAWRLNSQRVILGEVRGAEIMELFNILGGGAGGMGTVHANSAHAAVERIVTLAMGAGQHVSPDYAQRMVGSFVDLIVHVDVAETASGAKHRYISEVVALEHTGDGLARTDVFRAGPDRVARLVHMPHHLATALGL